MNKEALEKNLTKFLATGLFLISATVSTEGFTDPVNVPKLLLLGVFATASIGFLTKFRSSYKGLQMQAIFVSLGLFVIFSLAAVVKSSSPLVQNIYGSYGRNNGVLAYLFLSILVLSGSVITDRKNHNIFLKSIIYVGYVNLAYCLWVILFGDFLPWNNPYGNILGTFGNPNFIGAFFGIFFGVLVAIGLGPEASRRFKLSLIAILPLTLFEIVESQAIQGRVLAALASAIVGFFFLKYRFKRTYTAIYATLCIGLGSLALAGAFQKGPLTDLIYKNSVSLRGQYWLAAWNTGQENPVFGVGMDGFGDWYRRARDLRALELPGINTVVNTAHNVPLDMLAFGGWPLFIAYLIVMGLAMKSLIRIATKLQSYDGVAVGLITAWICYQVQSIISINQIGLAVWGWLLSGLLIGYEKSLIQINANNSVPKTETKGKRFHETTVSPGSVLAVSFLGLAGLLIALPPVSADIKWRSAQISQDALKLEQTMEASYFNPQNAQKYMQNIQAFESSGLFDISHKYALEAVEWNPESYELWRIVYLIKNSTPAEKETAISKMKTLDPLNPDVTAR
jgi:hypothetical protein